MLKSLIAALALLLAAPAALAQPQAPQGVGGGPQQVEPMLETRIGPLFSAPLGDDHLFGDWGGARTWLSDHGIDLRLNWLTENAGNVSGGQRQGFDFSGQVALEIDLDFGKIANLPGFAVHSMIVNGNGRSTSQDYINDDLDAVQEIYGGRGNVIAHLVYLYGEWAANDDRIDVAGGWLPVGTYFATSPQVLRLHERASSAATRIPFRTTPGRRTGRRRPGAGRSAICRRRRPTSWPGCSK